MVHDPYIRLRRFYQSISGNRQIQAADTGAITLVSGTANDTIFIQQIHVEITTINGGGELWSFRDSSPVSIVPSVATSAIAHFDFDFGPYGVPCTQGTDFQINITVATGAVGWVDWEGYRKRTAVAAA